MLSSILSLFLTLKYKFQISCVARCLGAPGDVLNFKKLQLFIDFLYTNFGKILSV